VRYKFHKVTSYPPRSVPSLRRVRDVSSPPPQLAVDPLPESRELSLLLSPFFLIPPRFPTLITPRVVPLFQVRQHPPWGRVIALQIRYPHKGTFQALAICPSLSFFPPLSPSYLSFCSPFPLSFLCLIFYPVKPRFSPCFHRRDPNPS